MSVIKKKGQKWVVKEKDKGKPGKELSQEFDSEEDARKAKRKIDGGTVRKELMKYSGRKSK